MRTQNTVGERVGGSATNGKEGLDVRCSDLLFKQVILVEEENLAMADVMSGNASNGDQTHD
jgi:phosphoribosyl-ATP pyrophosphohydrolase